MYNLNKNSQRGCHVGVCRRTDFCQAVFSIDSVKCVEYCCDSVHKPNT